MIQCQVIRCKIEFKIQLDTTIQHTQTYKYINKMRNTYDLETNKERDEKKMEQAKKKMKTQIQNKKRKIEEQKQENRKLKKTKKK